MVTEDIHFILFLINGETHLRSNQGQERDTKIEENTTFVLFEKKRILTITTVSCLELVHRISQTLYFFTYWRIESGNHKKMWYNAGGIA